jgi:segregation and condensation protein A
LRSALTEACTLRLNNFEGPFDLLFYLIEKNKIDIYDIPILEITEQYLDYLSAMREMDLEIASEFLVMAATLLHIKSRMLLPTRAEQEEEQEDPREELILKLVAYKKYKEFSETLREREAQWSKVHYKLPEAIPQVMYEDELEVSPVILRQCMLEALERSRRKMNDVSKKMQRILDHERVSLKAKIREIISILAKGVRFCFSKLFAVPGRSRLEVATSFLALLEIVKLGRAGIEQPAAFGEIYVDPVKTRGSGNRDLKGDSDFI